MVTMLTPSLLYPWKALHFLRIQQERRSWQGIINLPFTSSRSLNGSWVALEARRRRCANTVTCSCLPNEDTISTSLYSINSLLLFLVHGFEILELQVLRLFRKLGSGPVPHGLCLGNPGRSSSREQKKRTMMMMRNSRDSCSGECVR